MGLGDKLMINVRYYLTTIQFNPYKIMNFFKKEEQHMQLSNYQQLIAEVILKHDNNPAKQVQRLRDQLFAIKLNKYEKIIIK